MLNGTCLGLEYEKLRDRALSGFGNQTVQPTLITPVRALIAGGPDIGHLQFWHSLQVLLQ